MSTKDMRFYRDELNMDECFCERSKKPGRPLCYKCYMSLPEDMKRDLWQRIGNGYEAAYDAAVKWLIQEG